MTTSPQTPIGVTLGLGPAWQPAPGSCEIVPLTTNDGSAIFVLKLNTVGGAMALAMTRDDLRQLADQALEQTTGLSVVRQAAAELNGRRAIRDNPQA